MTLRSGPPDASGVAAPAARAARSSLRWPRGNAAAASTAALIALLAFALFASGLRWGLPHGTGPDLVSSWGVDDETPLGPLAQMHNILEPKPDRNLGYPLLYPFLAAAAIGPYLGVLLLTGGLVDPVATYPFGFADPVTALRRLAIIAHSVSTVMAVLVVLAAYQAARVAWDRRAGVLAALFVMTLYPMMYYARTGNVDMTMLGFTMLAFAACAHIVVRGFTIRRAVWLGVFVGLALATKEAALGAFIGMPFVVLAVRARENPGQRIGSMAFWKPHLLALGAAFLALGAGSGLFVEPGRYVAHLRFLAGRVDMLALGDATRAVRTFAYTFSDHVAFSGALLADLTSILTMGGLLLAVAGIIVAVARRERAALLALPTATYLLYVFFTLRAAQVRYVLPAAVLLAVFAGYAGSMALRARSLPARVAGVGLVAAVLVVQLLRGIDLTYQMVRDSRYAAGSWLASHARAGDRIDYFGASQKLPRMDAGWTVSRATEYGGMYVPARVDDSKMSEIRQRWTTQRTRFVIAIPDHASEPGAMHSHTFPPQLFQAMREGNAGFRLAGFFRTAPLFPWLPEPRLDYPTVNPPIHIFEAVGAR